MTNTRQETAQRKILRLRTGREWKRLLSKIELPMRLKLSALIWYDYFSLATFNSKPCPKYGDLLYPATLEWMHHPRWANVVIPAAEVEAALLMLGFGHIHASARAKINNKKIEQFEQNSILQP
jgi:hypothetical protein